MHHLTYGPIKSYEIDCVQQMIQDTEFSSMSFNRYAPPIFMARNKSNVAGFVYGQKGYGEDSHILTIHGTYLRNQFNDEQHENELCLAFINWAHDNLGVTHYRLHEFGTAKPIGISYVIPPPMVENFAPPPVEFIEAPVPKETEISHREYAYN